MPLNNFGFVDRIASKLFRSAQPDSEGLNTLNLLGIRTIIKLNDEFTSEIVDRRFHMIYMPLPTITFDYKQAVHVAEKVKDCIMSGNDTLVHCTWGRDRTGLIIGTYRLMYLDWTLNQVNEEREAYGVVGLQKLLDFDEQYMLQKIAEEVKK